MSDQPETTDDLIARMQSDDRLSLRDAILEQDQDGMGVDEYDLMSPREYAQARGLQPQMVYYYIRRGVIESYNCLCHRHVIDMNQADAALKERREQKKR